MTSDEWFSALRAAFPPGTDAPTATAAETAALLDLARVAAHASERWTAPVSTFLAGVAFATSDRAERAEALRSLVVRLERGGT